MRHLIEPCGGQPVDLLVPQARVEALKKEAFNLPSVDLDWHQIGELEMLLSGAYAPLRGYMGRADYESVLERLSLADGTAWPLPLTLNLNDRQAGSLKPGDRVALRDSEGFMLAVLSVAEIWPAAAAGDRRLLKRAPVPEGVELAESGWHVGGSLEGVSLPMHHDFSALRMTPAELRAHLGRRGWHKIVAYPTARPMHRAQFEFCLRSAIEQEANLLLLPFGGGDLVSHAAYFTLMRTFQAIMPRFPAATTQLSMLPVAAAPASAREKLMRAILARNYGCSHVIIDGEHAGDFDVLAAAAGIGVTVIPFPRMQYVEDRDEYVAESELTGDMRATSLEDEEFRRRLQSGLKIPEWHAFPEVIAELNRSMPPRDRQGFTVFFTGLSGAGKSTLARALAIRLMELGGRPVSLLDGDIVRHHLSSELGFSREHRDINVRRIGFVASEITKNRGVAVCAPIAPYRQTRRDVRSMIEAVGGFIEVYVSTPIETCEARDRKGLYAKARAGLIPEFTGVSDPYEVPETPEVMLDTTELSVDEAIQRILLKLEHEGYLR